jgi:hypothetical protein
MIPQRMFTVMTAGTELLREATVVAGPRVRALTAAALAAALLLEMPFARADLAGMEQPLRGDSRISSILDHRYAQTLGRASEAGFLTPTRLAANWPDADHTKQSAAGLPARPWSMTFSGTKLFHDGDGATLMTYVPMRSSKIIEKVVGGIFQSEDAGSFASDLQAVSAIARGRINTELRYSTQFNSYSRFDAAATYRLNSHTSSAKSDFVLGLYYRAAF